MVRAVGVFYRRSAGAYPPLNPNPTPRVRRCQLEQDFRDGVRFQRSDLWTLIVGGRGVRSPADML